MATRLLGTLLFLTLLAGCGQKGPLRLPDDAANEPANHQAANQTQESR